MLTVSELKIETTPVGKERNELEQPFETPVVLEFAMLHPTVKTFKRSLGLTAELRALLVTSASDAAAIVRSETLPLLPAILDTA